MLKPVSLRGYQRRILNTTLQCNTIVLLPTGAGKTFIAAEAIIGVGFPALFLVPTIPLVNQQAEALRSRPNMPCVGEFHGERVLPDHFDVLVTTPKAFEMAQGRGVFSLQWSRFQIVVFDEVHHVIKDHPYRNLALKLRLSGHHPRVIGLTASLTYAVGEQKIKKSVQQLCKELQIDRIERADDQELRIDGYHGVRRRGAEVRLPEQNSNSGVVSPELRKPHEMHSTFFNRVKISEATPFATNLVCIIRSLENEAKKVSSNFVSPLCKASLKSWGEYAKKQAKKQAKTQGHKRIASLEHWYESLRILVISWEESDEAAFAFLEMMKCREDTACWSDVMAETIEAFFTSKPSSSTRFEHMFNILEEKINHHGINTFRGIIFVKQRVLTHILEHVIRKHPTLRRCLRTRCLYSAKSPATASLSMSRTQSEESLQAFASGDANLLITTNVAEEGLDVPSANCVVYFDSMDHAVSFVQGRGRARQEDSSFVVLSERTDRPATLLAQQEIEQHRLASRFIPTKEEESNIADLNSQQQRESGAAKYLVNITENNALANLNIYCKKTKVLLSEEIDSGSTCHMVYKSVLRDIKVTGKGNGKKAARKLAAFKMLGKLASSPCSKKSKLNP